MVSPEAVQDSASNGETDPSAAIRVSASKTLRKTLRLIGEVSSIGSSVSTSEPCETTTVVARSAADAGVLKASRASRAVPRTPGCFMRIENIERPPCVTVFGRYPLSMPSLALGAPFAQLAAVDLAHPVSRQITDHA